MHDMKNNFDCAFYSYPNGSDAMMELFDFMNRHSICLMGIKLTPKVMAKVRHELMKANVNLEQFR